MFRLGLHVFPHQARGFFLSVCLLQLLYMSFTMRFSYYFRVRTINNKSSISV